MGQGERAAAPERVPCDTCHCWEGKVQDGREKLGKLLVLKLINLLKRYINLLGRIRQRSSRGRGLQAQHPCTKICCCFRV